MSFPLHNTTLVNCWREALAVERINENDSLASCVSLAPLCRFREHSFVSGDLNALFPHLKSPDAALAPLSAEGLSTDSPQKVSHGLGFVLEDEEGEDASSKSDSDLSLSDTPTPGIEESTTHISRENDMGEEITPTLENTRHMDAKPTFERFDSARTINSGVTDESDEIEHVQRLQEEKPSLLRTMSSPVQKPDKSPVVKQGQIQTGLKTISRFILPKLGSGHGGEILHGGDISSQEGASVGSQEEASTSFRSKRLMSKRKPPPSVSLDAASVRSLSSSFVGSPNDSGHIIEDAAISPTASVVDSIASSDLVDSDYSYNSASSESMAQNAGIDPASYADDLDSDEYTNEADLYDSFFDGGSPPVAETAGDISQINFKRLRPQVRSKPGSTRESNTLASSLMMKIDIDDLHAKEEDQKAANEQSSQKPLTPHLHFPKVPVHTVSAPSNLTELLHKIRPHLDYYSYVGDTQSPGDIIVDIHASLLDTTLNLRVNSSCSIVDLIGYALSVFSKGSSLDPSLQDPNAWKAYLVDSDGEVEDDFGPLDRCRIFKSYGGAEDLSIVQCSDTERVANEKITPSPLVKQDQDVVETSMLTVSSQEPDVHETSPDMPYGTLAGTLQGTLPTNLVSPMKPAKYVPVVPTVEDEDSEDEDEPAVHLPGKDINKYLRKTMTEVQTPPNIAANTSRSKFKTSSKTIQSILHNTADHYQLTQEQLFGGRGGMTDDTGALPTYHRWTIWRRQQMTLKAKQHKTLTVDGYQVYILPFNDLDGSWYESKTYSFNISQILKIKQSEKAPSHFKIVVNKNTSDGMVKKYYLEAQSKEDCSEIVGTIRRLAKGMHQ